MKPAASHVVQLLEHCDQVILDGMLARVNELRGESAGASRFACG